MRRRAIRRFFGLGVPLGVSSFVAALSGCAATPPAAAPAAVLLGAQLQRQDDALIGEHFRTLLDFEHDADRAFVRSPGRDYVVGHTGSHALGVVAPASVSVGSVLFGAALPGEWTLLGAYVRAGRPAEVGLTLLADGRPMASAGRALPAGVWGFVAVDLTTITDAAAMAGAKRVELRVDGPASMALDDVILVDNRRSLAGGVWAVDRVGLSLRVAVAGGAVRKIPLAGPTGWAVDEANGLRLRLHELAGPRQWTLLADGRSVVDGRAADGRAADGAAAASPERTGEIVIDDAAGRVDRETPGDARNDGYNEARGAYEVVAKRPRLTLTLRPTPGDGGEPGGESGGPGDAPVGPPVPPLLEIRGLPAGPLTVTAAGRLIDRVVRLDDGTALVLLPARLDGATEVTVSTSGN